MFEKLRIKEHMEVVDAGGSHLGTVDELDGDTIKLTRSDSGDGVHHYLPFDSVDRVDDNRVYLKEGAAPQLRQTGGQYAAGAAGQQFNGAAGTIDPDRYSTQTSAEPGASSEQPLFGTSGTGTGMGGSGKGEF